MAVEKFLKDFGPAEREIFEAKILYVTAFRTPLYLSREGSDVVDVDLDSVSESHFRLDEKTTRTRARRRSHVESF